MAPLFGVEERSESWVSKSKTEANECTNKMDGIRQ